MRRKKVRAGVHSKHPEEGKSENALEESSASSRGKKKAADSGQSKINAFFSNSTTQEDSNPVDPEASEEGIKTRKGTNAAKNNASKELEIKLTRCDGESSKSNQSDLESSSSVNGKSDRTPNSRKGRGNKRKKEEESEDEESETEKPKKLTKKETAKGKGSREKIPDVTSLDLSNDSKSPSDKAWNFKIASWNVNGIRAWLEKNGISYLHEENPDVMCIQETKCSDDKLPEEVKEIEGYQTYWLSGDKDGYSGVGILSKQKPLKIEYGIGISEHDNEGRVITAEYEKFYLVAAYVPNSGRKLVRLDYRMKWDEDFRAYLKKLDGEKPVVLCGDLNVAHKEIDLANPKSNKRNAGFTQEERDAFSSLLEEGSFVDSFRRLHPDETGAYTFWTYMMNARKKNVGWRLDYFVVSDRLCDSLCDSVIRKDVLGSDHCPIALFLSL